MQLYLRIFFLPPTHYPLTLPPIPRGSAINLAQHLNRHHKRASYPAGTLRASIIPGTTPLTSITISHHTPTTTPSTLAHLLTTLPPPPSPTTPIDPLETLITQSLASLGQSTKS